MDIHLKHITMHFEGVSVIENLSLTIREGELVSLLGPSGCGKSTTLMLLSGLYKPTSGEVWFGDKNVTNVDAEKRGIGMVFQNYALYPHRTVLKNIMFPLKMQKVAKAEAKERALDMAKLVQIDHLLERKPGQLSGGQQQRVSIARALVKKPKLLLLDEPLSNLDARLRLEMREEIRRIQQEVGITTVFVTHDQEEALSISDRVMLMKDGVLQQVSEPQRMYRDPANAFVASFLGNPPINILSGEKTDDHGRYQVAGTGQTTRLFLPPPECDAQLDIGVRPEHLFLTNEAKAFLSGEIIYVETIGRDTLIRVKCGEVTVRALVDQDAQVAVGDTCHLGIKPENMLLFHAETGARLGNQPEEGRRKHGPSAIVEQHI